MKVGIAIKKGSPEVGVIVKKGGKVVFSTFSFDGKVEEALFKKIKETKWNYQSELNDGAARLLEGALAGDDVFNWSVVTKKSGKVLKELMKVKGTITYGDLAKKCGTAPRAVGQIMNKNPFAPFVPCHRVVAKNGIGGFASGTEVKKKLLELDAKK